LVKERRGEDRIGAGRMESGTGREARQEEGGRGREVSMEREKGVWEDGV
jgi:hypothetical protein